MVALESKVSALVETLFDELAYVRANPDVADAIRRHEFSSGREHYLAFGRAEHRPLSLPEVDGPSYLAANPDVAAAVAAGEFRDARHHYCQAGWTENRCLAAARVTLATGVIAAQEFTTGAEPLTALSVRYATTTPAPEGVLELRLYDRAPATPPEGSDRSRRLVRWATVDLRHLYDGESYDWLFAPLPAAAGAWTLEVEVTRLTRGPAPALVAHLREGRSALLGRTVSPAALDAEWTFDVVPHVAPLWAPAPRGLSYSAVTRCNLNCTHCVSRVTRRRVRRLSDVEIARFVPFLQSHGLPEGVVSDYSGDPLFAEITQGGVLDLLEQLNTTIGLTTNGNVMTPELAHRITGPRYGFVCFSIDAARPTTYGKIRRGAGSLENVLANARAVVEARRRRGAIRPQLVFNVVLMRSNVEELRELVDLARTAGVDAINGVHLIAMTDDMESESLCNHPARYNAERTRALAYASERAVKLYLPPPFEDRPPAIGHAVCHEPWRGVSVLGNGDVQACCMPESVMGNLRENTLEEIWNGPVYRELRARVNSDHPPEFCQHCPIARLRHNPTSFLYYRARARLRRLRDELTPAIAAAA